MLFLVHPYLPILVHCCFPLTWEEALEFFTDKTGQPGPVTWQVGDYPDGEDEYPVAGVSWYEAFAYGGVRTYIQQLHSELKGTNLELDITPVWVEPIIGLENQFTWKHWLVNVQGDYGGLFSQNKNSIQISAFVFYRMGRLTSIKFGWNHLYLNRINKILGQDYTVKLTLSGPAVGVAFHF